MREDDEEVPQQQQNCSMTFSTQRGRVKGNYSHKDQANNNFHSKGRGFRLAVIKIVKVRIRTKENTPLSHVICVVGITTLM